MRQRLLTRAEIIARLVSIQTLMSEMLMARYAPQDWALIYMLQGAGKEGRAREVMEEQSPPSQKMLDDTRHEFSDAYMDLVSESIFLKTLLGDK